MNFYDQNYRLLSFPHRARSKHDSALLSYTTRSISRTTFPYLLEEYRLSYSNQFTNLFNNTFIVDQVRFGENVRTSGFLLDSGRGMLEIIPKSCSFVMFV